MSTTSGKHRGMSTPMKVSVTVLLFIVATVEVILHPTLWRQYAPTLRDLNRRVWA